MGEAGNRALVMPGLVPGTHDFNIKEDVDGRDKPGHDGWWIVVP
jgi:hypothetical protein